MKENKAFKILFIVTIFIFCIGYCCINAYPDNDLWIRLIAGNHIIEKLSILKADFLSYSPTHDWYDHEWGASVFFALALKFFGESGLILLKGILCALTIFICYKTVEIRKPKNSISYNILYFVLMFFVIEKSLGAVPRCLLFTCLFYCLFLYLLERVRQGNKKLLILLPPIMMLWSNIHGGCLSGLGLIFLYIIGEALNKKTVKEYIIAFVASLCSLFINPYGFNYVKFLFFAGTMNRELIFEWESPFLIKHLGLYLRYKIYLPIMLTVLIFSNIKNKISYEKMDKTKLLIILTTAILSILHIRHIPFFVLSAGVLLYDEFYGLFNQLINKIKEYFKINDEISKTFVLAKEVIIYFFLLILTLPNVISEEKRMDISNTMYPYYAVEFIKQNELKGNLFVNFDWGSYAAYKLYPQNLVVIDGRYEEVYNLDLMQDQTNFYTLSDDWYKILRENKSDILLIEKFYPVYEKILNLPDWTKIFEDEYFSVFVPTGTEKSSYILPTSDIDYYNKNLFYTDIKFSSNI